MTFAESLATAKDRLRTLLAEIGVASPKELDQ